MRYKLAFIFCAICWIATTIDRKNDKEEFKRIADVHNEEKRLYDSINEFRFDSLSTYYQQGTIFVTSNPQ